MVRVVKQKYVRSTLNAGQIGLLELVYKYRFGSRQLLAESLGVRPENGLYEKLEVLVKREYLGKRFEKLLKLQGVPAAYYLAPKGMRALQEIPGYETITDAVIKASYKNKTVGMSFVINTLNVYKYTNILKRRYGGLRVFTRREIGHYEYFPSQLPDAVLSLATSARGGQKRFFFDLVPDSTPRSALDRRILNYCEFFDEGGWDVTGSDLPTILLLTEGGLAEKRVQRNVRIQLNHSDMEELAVYTSTTTALKNTENDSIWTHIEDTDELVALNSIS